MRIKICGITTPQDARLAIEQGAWALGFNFYPTSPRAITQNRAKTIIDQLSSSTITVGIFIDEPYDKIARVMDETGLTLAQVYAPLKEAPPHFKQKLLLALPISTKEALPTRSLLDDYGYILLDAPKTDDHPLGGTGRLANWPLAASIARDHRLILAGGLNATNVKRAIHEVNPYAIDLASGIESSPGIKDPLKMKHFFMECTDDN